MPYTQEEKNIIIEARGLDPKEYVFDEATSTISKREIIPQPTVNPHPVEAKNIGVTTAAYRGARSNIGGAGLGLAAASASLPLAAAVATAFPPLAPVTGIGIPLIAGLGGAFLGSSAQGAIEPERWKEELAQSTAERPYSTFGGQLAIGLSPFGPNTTAIRGLGRLATATGARLSARELAALKTAAVQAGIGGGMETGVQAYEAARDPNRTIGEIFDPIKIAAAAAAQGVFSRPNVVGRKVFRFPGELPEISPEDTAKTKAFFEGKEAALADEAQKQANAKEMQKAGTIGDVGYPGLGETTATPYKTTLDVPIEQPKAPLKTSPLPGETTAGKSKIPRTVEAKSYGVNVEELQAQIDAELASIERIRLEAVQEKKAVEKEKVIAEVNRLKAERKAIEQAATEEQINQIEETKLQAEEVKLQAKLQAEDTAKLQAEKEAMARTISRMPESIESGLQTKMGVKFEDRIPTEISPEVSNEVTVRPEESVADLRARDLEAEVSGEPRAKYSTAPKEDEATKLGTKLFEESVTPKISKEAIAALKIAITNKQVNSKEEAIAFLKNPPAKVVAEPQKTSSPYNLRQAGEDVRGAFKTIGETPKWEGGDIDPEIPLKKGELYRRGKTSPEGLTLSAKYASPSTGIHEAAHRFLEQLYERGTNRDRRIIDNALDLHGYKGKFSDNYSSEKAQAEESLVKLVEKRGYSRQSEPAFRKFWREAKAGWTEKLTGKTLDPEAIIAQRLLRDRPLGKVKGKDVKYLSERPTNDDLVTAKAKLDKARQVADQIINNKRLYENGKFTSLEAATAYRAAVKNRNLAAVEFHDLVDSRNAIEPTYKEPPTGLPEEPKAKYSVGSETKEDIVRTYTNDPEEQKKLFAILDQGPVSEKEHNPYKPWTAEWVMFEKRPPKWEERFTQAQVGMIRNSPFIIDNESKTVYMRDEKGEWYQKTLWAANDDGLAVTLKDNILKGRAIPLSEIQSSDYFGLVKHLNSLVKDLSPTKELPPAKYSVETEAATKSAQEEALELGISRSNFYRLLKQTSGNIEEALNIAKNKAKYRASGLRNVSKERSLSAPEGMEIPEGTYVKGKYVPSDVEASVREGVKEAISHSRASNIEFDDVLSEAVQAVRSRGGDPKKTAMGASNAYLKRLYNEQQSAPEQLGRNISEEESSLGEQILDEGVSRTKDAWLSHLNETAPYEGEKSGVADWLNEDAQKGRMISPKEVASHIDPQARYSTASIDDLPPEAPKGYLPIIGSMIARVRRISPEAGEYLNNHFARKSSLQGKYVNLPLEELSKFKFQEVEQTFKEFRNLYRNNTGEITHPEIAEVLSSAYTTPRDDQIRLGLKIHGREAGKSQYYVPDELSIPVLEELSQRPNSPESKSYKRQWAEYLQEQKLSEEDATSLVNNYQEALSADPHNYKAIYFGALDKAAGLGLPEALREINPLRALRRYGNRTANRLAFWQEIQKDHSDLFGIERDENTPALYSDLSAEPAVRAAMAQIIGTGRTIGQQRFMAIARTVANSILGTATGIRDTVSIPLNSMPYVKGDLGILFKGFLNMRQERVNALKMNAYKKGLDTLAWGEQEIPDRVSDMIGKVAQVLRVLSGREHIERFNRVATFSIGKELARLRLLQGDLGFFKKFGTLVEGDLFKMEGVQLENALNQVAKNFVDRNQGTYDPRGLPSFNPTIEPWLALSKWSIEKSNVIWEDVFQPMKKGDYKPFLYYTLGSVMTGLGIRELNTLINNKRPQDPSLKEVEAGSGKAKDYVAAFTSLMQLGQYVGILGDTAKAISDITLRGKTPNQYVSFPAAQFMQDNVVDNIRFFSEAVQQGEDPIRAIGTLVLSTLENANQSFRLIANHSFNAEKSKRSEKFRDKRIFDELQGKPVGNIPARRNPALNQNIEQYKLTGDIEEALSLLPKIVNTLKVRYGDRPDRLLKAIQGLSQNSYQTFPNPRSSPLQAQKYYKYLQTTLGEDEAKERLLDYAKQTGINQVKSSILH